MLCCYGLTESLNCKETVSLVKRPIILKEKTKYDELFLIDCYSLSIQIL